MSENKNIYTDHFKKGLAPDPDLNIAQWSNKYRILSQNAEPGPYRIERTPFLKEVAEVLSPSSPIEVVVFMKSTQVGASELGFNWIGYVMHSVPGPMMMVQPTEAAAEKVSKQRIAPMIEETAVLRESITGQTVLNKEFRGGFLNMVGANSPVGLSSVPIRFLFLDEVDRFPHDAGGEGDPVTLAKKRTTTFSRRKIYMVSTPTVKDSSRIEFEYLQSDQRRFFVPCPKCGAMQYLQWRQMTWTNDDPKTARYKCEHCQELLEERHKTEMLENGQWTPTAKGDGKTAGFHISALYSPVGWKSWEDLVGEFLTSRADAPMLKAFVNTNLGETWEESYQAKVGADQIMNRLEDYSPLILPSPVLLVTAGVDVQDDRLEITLYGWGKDEEVWTLSHTQILGDPSLPHVWAQLENKLDEPLKHEIANDLAIRAAAIDSGGHFTHEVYQFTRAKKHKNWIAIKGQSQKGKPVIGKGTKVDINFRGQIMKSGGVVFPVGSDTGKSVLYSRLKHNEPGPGYIHFHSGLTTDFFNQLTAEKQVTRYVKGFPIKEWVKKSGARNEALDCFVYAYAALNFIMSQYNRQTFWKQMQARLVLKVKNEKGELVEVLRTNESEKKNATKKGTIKSSRKSFVNSW